MSPGPSSDDRDDETAPAGRSHDAWTDAARARADRLHQRQPPRPAPRERKAWFQQLPAKLAAAVVFLVALTTLLGNLLELREKSGQVFEPAAPAPAAPATAAKPQANAPAGPVRVRIALDRIAVLDDGSPGTTDWRFTVEADGQPLLAFEQENLDDIGGRNVARPKDVEATLRLPRGHAPRLSVKGWRLSRFRIAGGAPDAIGEAVLPANGEQVRIRVAARGEGSDAFVFYFSGDAQPSR